jgi:hypothetical protein|tara:strand:- start:2053 stop:2955 length:903 start_codon:yes stop_codon:yes gene_type:complete
MSCNCSKVKEAKKYIKDRGSVKMGYTQTLAVGELDIVSFCNLSCYGCNRFMDVMSSKDMMTVEQVAFFVDESIELNWPWRELRIMGGEPSTHPKFQEILNEMMRLKRFNPNITMKVITNGSGEKVKERLKLVPPEILVMNSEMRYADKENFIPDFGNSHLAPIDRLPIKKNEVEATWRSQDGVIPSSQMSDYDEDTVYSCQIHQTCGLGISHNGILPCGCGNAIARVAGLDFYFKSLKEVTIEGCHERLKTLCGLCGRNLNYTIQVQHNRSRSEFWDKTIKSYKKEKPILSSSYGAQGEI